MENFCTRSTVELVFCSNETEFPAFEVELLSHDEEGLGNLLLE